MQPDHDHDQCLSQIARLERENSSLKIQLLTVTRDLSNVLGILTSGYEEWGNDGH